jgi:hypothetical protein
MFVLHGTEPVNWIYEVKQRIEYYTSLKTSKFDEREIAFIEDELLPTMENYLNLCSQIDEENEQKEQEAHSQFLSTLR